MEPLWAALAGSLVTLVGGGAWLWRELRKGGASPQAAPPTVSEMGYGPARWAREQALWRGVLRRLEIQARHQHPPSERLLAEMEEARRRLAEADRHLAP